MISLQRVVVRAVLAAMLGTTFAGAGICDSDRWFEYWAHADSVTPGAGNAVAANIATQMVNPWPAHSARKRIDLDGKRAQKAIKRYETNTSIAPNGLEATRQTRPSSFENGASVK